MARIVEIEFEVEVDKGEIPYRSYTTTEPVLNNMFVMVSKLLADDSVFYKVYACDVKTGEAHCRVERTVTQEKFRESVTVLEQDLQKANPTVKLVAQTRDVVAVGPNGPISPDKLPDEAVQKIKELEELKKKFFNKEIAPVDFLVEATKKQLFSPEDMAGIMASLPLDVQLEVAERLGAEFKIKPDLVNKLKATLNRAHTPSTDTPISNRIGKYL